MEQIKKYRDLRMLFAVVMIGMMVGVAQLLQEKEIIFPEIAALVIGAWVCERQPWKVNRIQMVLLMSLSAAAGVVIVRYLPLPLFFQLLIGMVFIITVLILSRTTMLPIISACILPILMRTDSFVYLAAVVVMTLMIVLVQRMMEKMQLLSGNVIGCENKNVYDNEKENEKGAVKEAKIDKEIGRWILILTGFLGVAAIAVATEHIFFIAPPLIVTLAAVSQPGNAAVQHPIILWSVITFCAMIGAAGRAVCMETTIPMFATAMGLMVLVLAAMQFAHCMFPPAGALALLPLIIATEKVLYYPLQVALGAAVFLLIGRMIRERELENRKE